MRDCGRPLARDGQRLVCDAGHAFDVARTGYVSLLQPQDRRSSSPGDTREAVDARARLLEAGIGRTLIDAIVERATATLAQPPVVTVDLGCGSGELLAAIGARRPTCGIGIDLSTAAIERAARQFPDLTWVVANADRRLPLLDGSAHVVLSLNGRRNPAECARVLMREGALIVGVPARDDLVELRAAVQGEAVERQRTDAVLAEHAARFTVVDHFTARERHRLEGEALRAVLAGTYRGQRAAGAARAAALDALDVTFATDVVIMRRG